jgi:hypothetical protein
MNTQTLCSSSTCLRTFAIAAALILIAGSGFAQVSTGTGTAGKIPLWTGPHAQGNSVMTQMSDGKIGIGTTAPAGRFSVVGTGVAAALLGRNTNSGSGVLAKSVNGFGVEGYSTNSIAGYFTSDASYGGYFSSSNNDAADFHGAKWGIYVRNTGAFPAVDAASTADSSYAGYFVSSAYRAGYFKSGNSGLYSLYVDTQDGPSQGTAALNVNGAVRVEGNLVVAGSKTGYVVDHMQNADDVALQTGDVVIIADDSVAPVLGQIPTPRIKRASSANDTAVVGVVDQVTFVPDASTRQAYEAQQNADRDATARAQGVSRDETSKLAPMAAIQNRISDAAGTLHADEQATSAAPGGYCSVVTLGAYKAVKVDASFGAIRAGDLLTTSAHAGYAMKVQNKAAASGAIIGKALSSLASGTGTVTVMVTLK